MHVSKQDSSMAFQYMTAILKKKGFGITMLKQRKMITDVVHYYYI